MANNRMGIECTCGGYMGIAKHFGADWSLYGPDSFAERLESFLKEHRWCERGSDGAHFRIVAESDRRPE